MPRQLAFREAEAGVERGQEGFPDNSRCQLRCEGGVQGRAVGSFRQGTPWPTCSSGSQKVLHSQTVPGSFHDTASWHWTMK